ncbi:nitrile hydratase [Leisingera sp. ANG-M1]|uniref:nitrile hydratase accessory protein n=1 Tax=Leisingera sp. ANG-M1 TaxID=1577895 RepID=UPI00057FFD03|nr:nitrile hydratase accessory protein [Leisingera sp. ANG-M1]KIC12350.1 nitrile hydratase [Leisingera sp. ANG-M1]
MSSCAEVSAPEPVFAEPWHAQVFALTVHLNEAGRFSWAEWVERFSATLKRHGLSRELDGGEDYFRAWLETLEVFLAEQGVASGAEAEQMRCRWEAAYLNTPHGEPVQIEY